jgi:prepilin-type N-terminal cleavage/methylation domain-containing protein
MHRPTDKMARHGFTMMELLIVIAIIAVLLALGVGAAYKAVDAQRTATTEDLLRNVDKTMHTHWSAVVADAKKETPSASVLALAGGNEARAQVLWIKLRLAEAFPQSYAEVKLAIAGQGIYGTGPAGPWIEPDKRRYMATYYNSIKLAAAGKPATESSACMVVALKVNRNGAALDVGNLANSLVDTDNDGLKELVDAWGNPLSFVRFPIGNDELANLNPRANSNLAKFGDPLDPTGLLQLDNWFASNGSNFSALFLTGGHPFPAPNPQPYWVPYFYSNGRDELPGTVDDLLSFRLRIGDKGD